MEKIKNYIPDNPNFFKVGQVIPNNLPLELSDIKDQFDEFARPANTMEVDRYMDIVEISQCHEEIDDMVKEKRPIIEEALNNANAELEVAKRHAKAIKAEYDVLHTQISDKVATLKAGLIKACLEPEKTYMAYRSGYMYFYTQIGNRLKLAHFRQATEKEKESYQTGLFAKDDRFKEAI